MHRTRVIIGTFALLVLVVSCGGDDRRFSDEPLSQEQLKHGIGPIDTVQLGPMEPQLARRGEQIFRSQCMKCHTLDKSVLGPPLRNIARKRTPEFIMNMILNPQENVMRHPVLQKYHKQYNQYMSDVGLDSTRARMVLEYLRSVSAGD